MGLKILILFHLLGACVWIGGHLVLAISVLPKALREKNPELILAFEERFERVGIPSLLLQVITGLWMASIYSDFSDWFSFDNVVNTHISLKLILLITTLILAIHARLFIIPKLSKDNLSFLAIHIAAVTAIALVLLFIGLNFRLRMI